MELIGLYTAVKSRFTKFKAQGKGLKFGQAFWAVCTKFINQEDKMDRNELQRLERFALEIRLNTVKSLHHLGFGHYGGSLSIVECLSVLYGKVMNIDPKEPDKKDRDYFILSKGHAGPGLYSALALKGYFPMDVLMTLNANGTKLPSHPDRQLTTGVDMTTGSLGQGISAACGVAKSFKISKSDQKVYSIVGDGELNEGQCWEAFQFAAHNKLDNLFVFLDDNKKQLDGYTKDICDGACYEDKFKAFGFDTYKVKGNSIEEIYEAIEKASKVSGKPHMIILDTIKGQGFKYLEEKFDNHHLRPTPEEVEIIAEYIKELENQLGGVQNA
jgi:transketolase